MSRHHPMAVAPASGPIRHRVAPAPVGSGISFRSLPSASFVSIIQACQHFEDKCAGQTDAKSLAVRCLYDLSREVQDIVRVLKSNEDTQAHKIRELETILREWNEVFAEPSARLQAAGVSKAAIHPAALAKHILTLSDTLKANDLETTAQRLTLEKEVSDLRNALRDAQRAGREETAQQLGRLKGEADSAIAHARAQNVALSEQLEHLKANIDQRVASDTAFRVEQDTRSLRKTVSGLEQQLQQADAAAQAAARAASLEAERLKAQLAAARDDMGHMAARHEASYGEFSVRTGRDAAEVRVEVARLERLLAATIEDWQEKYEGLHARWAHSTAAARVTSLEDQVVFYKKRTGELQELVQAYQSALVQVGKPPVSQSTLQHLSAYRDQEPGEASRSTAHLGQSGSDPSSSTGSSGARMGSSGGHSQGGPRVSGSGRSSHGQGKAASVTFATRPMAGSPVGKSAAASPPSVPAFYASHSGRASHSGVGAGRPMVHAAVVRHAAVDGMAPGAAPTQTVYYTAR